jgi:hypothetical protein
MEATETEKPTLAGALLCLTALVALGACAATAGDPGSVDRDAAAGSATQPGASGDAGSGSPDDDTSTSSGGRPGDDASPGDGAFGGEASPPTGAASDGGASDVSVATPIGLGDPSLPRRLILENRCPYAVWADALPKTTLPNGVPLEVLPDQAFSVGWPNGWSGRVWGKKGCVAANGGALTCANTGANSLAEFTLTKTPDAGLDYYDVSLVDGFNIPIGIVNVGHPTDQSRIYNCGSPICAKDLLAGCPAPLQETGANADVVSCHNDSCKVLGNSVMTSPYCMYPNQYTQYFKNACPTSYSYPYDDPTSTFTCKSGQDYQVVFCPTEGAQAGLP